MQIRHYTADDAEQVRGAVAVLNAAGLVDSPWVHPSTERGHALGLRHGWDGEPSRAYVAVADGRVVGQAELSVSEWDNRHLAWADVTVHPDHRRRGLGSELLDFLQQEARAAGRTSVGCGGWDVEPARAFAARHGFERRSTAINRRQYLDKIDPGALRTLYDGALEAAAAYELVRYAGRTPEPMLEPVAVLTAAINDAPTDDLDIVDEVFTAARIAAYEDAQIGQERRLYRLLARHRVTGELGGHTVVAVEAERPHVGHQHDTSVVRAHRGHRLGLLLKSAMVLWLAGEEPQLQTVDTWNAESNDHMIAVNEELGYQVLGRGVQYQRAL
ncbi:MAG: N-acetyltransferase family protein [Nocardioidaceae bacterium]